LANLAAANANCKEAMHRAGAAAWVVSLLSDPRATPGVRLAAAAAIRAACDSHPGNVASATVSPHTPHPPCPVSPYTPHPAHARALAAALTRAPRAGP